VFAPKTVAKTTNAQDSIWAPAFAGEIGKWVGVACIALAASSAHAKEKPVIAMTWDDLPAHSALPPGVTRVQVAADLLKAFADVKAEGFGFINGVHTEREPDSTPVLKLWREAGQPLGNHTWSHPNIADLETRFLDGAAAVADRSRAMSKALYGKDIPYVLLMHGGAFDARMAPRLLKLYQDKGFGFTTLAKAESHSFYKTDVDPSLPPAPTTLENAMRAKGLAVPAFPVDLKALEGVSR